MRASVQMVRHLTRRRGREAVDTASGDPTGGVARAFKSGADDRDGVAREQREPKPELLVAHNGGVRAKLERDGAKQAHAKAAEKGAQDVLLEQEHAQLAGPLAVREHDALDGAAFGKDGAQRVEGGGDLVAAARAQHGVLEDGGGVVAAVARGRAAARVQLRQHGERKVRVALLRKVGRAHARPPEQRGQLARHALAERRDVRRRAQQRARARRKAHRGARGGGAAAAD